MSKFPVKIYVVSLVNSDRRHDFTSTLKKSDIPFEFFDAIDGANSEHSVLRHYNEKKRLLRKNYPLLSGEIGCFASHYLLWEKCLITNEPIIILEDDAYPTKDFLLVLKQWKKLVAMNGVVKLYDSYKPKFKLISKIDKGINVVKSVKRTRGTVAYMLTPEAASKLLRKAQIWVDPVDDYMDSEWIHGAPVYSVRPNCFKLRKVASTIDRISKKPKSSFFLKIRRELINLPRMLKEKWHKLKLTLR